MPQKMLTFNLFFQVAWLSDGIWLSGNSLGLQSVTRNMICPYHQCFLCIQKMKKKYLKNIPSILFSALSRPRQTNWKHDISGVCVC